MTFLNSFFKNKKYYRIKLIKRQLHASSRPAWSLLNPLVYAGTKLAMMGRGKIKWLYKHHTPLTLVQGKGTATGE